MESSGTALRTDECHNSGGAAVCGGHAVGGLVLLLLPLRRALWCPQPALREALRPLPSPRLRPVPQLHYHSDSVSLLCTRHLKSPPG